MCGWSKGVPLAILSCICFSVPLSYAIISDLCHYHWPVPISVTHAIISVDLCHYQPLMFDKFNIWSNFKFTLTTLWSPKLHSFVSDTYSGMLTIWTRVQLRRFPLLLISVSFQKVYKSAFCCFYDLTHLLLEEFLGCMVVVDCLESSQIGFLKKETS